MAFSLAKLWDKGMSHLAQKAFKNAPD